MAASLKRLKSQLHHLLCIDTEDVEKFTKKLDQSSGRKQGDVASMRAAVDVDTATHALLIKTVDSFDLSVNSSVRYKIYTAVTPLRFNISNQHVQIGNLALLLGGVYASVYDTVRLPQSQVM